ncbi:MAG: glycosyltransferase family 9 protein [Flavobacteriales bacterium]|nr:glycosyltransferase family 9 protein [Flavobacteriales bacterium]MDG1779355.1 glycosyltransferase family 9 protein [Flavobacteriales bacterium]MDG2246371.1 glycosyltransferase family 9 protein [Flavobacteriales bacterium]
MSDQPKILVIRFSSIGDIVLTTPVFRVLKEQMEPSPEIHFLTKKQFGGLLEANPHVDRIHTIEKATAEIDATLKELHFDYVVDLHKNVRSSMVKRSLKALDFTLNKRNWDKWLLVRFGKDNLQDAHIVKRYLDTVRLFGMEDDGKGLDYYVPEKEEVKASTYSSAPFVAIALGAAHIGKKMTASQVEDVCAALEEDIILIGGKDDMEQGALLAERFPNRVFNAAGKHSIHGSASLIKQASVVVAADTGMMHIAAAFGKKLVSVWGCTTPSLGMSAYRPHPDSIVVEPVELDKRPCSKLGNKCKYGEANRCITHVTGDQISAAVKKLL